MELGRNRREEGFRCRVDVGETGLREAMRALLLCGIVGARYGKIKRRAVNRRGAGSLGLVPA